MDRDDILGRAAPGPDLVLRYGDGAEQVADFWFPAGGGAAAALVVFLHGGFWRAAYDRGHARPLAVALAGAGYAVVLPEYRRTGQAGGGWPGTFDDVARAVDVLPGLAREAVAGAAGCAAGPAASAGTGWAGTGSAGPGAVVLGGHSAGGHLALWAAARVGLPAGSPWAVAVPSCGGVVGLAAVSDLTGCARQRLGRGAAQALMGGGPRRHPERYAAADPARLVPVPVPVRLVHGAEDGVVPSEMSVGFARAAAAAGGGAVSCDVLPGCGHFELIDPLSTAWSAVLGAFRSVALPAAPAPDA
jgi:acetyl esterase/lipase